ncbi:MAG: choice-of-anchor J domain-containing protein [bacterium]
MKKNLHTLNDISRGNPLLLFLLLLFIHSGNLAQNAPADQSFLNGTVTNSLTGKPITGARIRLNPILAYSVKGGTYLLVADTSGTFSFSCSKPGFDSVASPPFTLVPGDTITWNVSLHESLSPPALVIANFDSITDVVHISFPAPSGPYEILYDDGIQDDFTIWAEQGNMNAVRFDPATYPAVLTGGMINIGTQANYPPGSMPLVPFQVRIFDATGPRNSPGNLIAGPFDVIPASFGWVEFQLPYPVTISSGPFFIAMVQGGNAPNASGLAVDLTHPGFRSYSRFVNGVMPWIPAQGNFMIRALVTGPGGPTDRIKTPDGLTGYKIWRLRQGEEINPPVWIYLGNTADNVFDDPSWNSLPCGPYRWGVSAGYPGNQWSPVVFSNVIGKCWTVPVTLKLNLTCEEFSTNGAFVAMKNLVYPDTSYSTIADSSGFVTFHNVWKGSYEISIRKFGYNDLLQNYSAGNADTVELTILQKKPSPGNLMVDDRTLFTVWNVPFYHQMLFSEDWISGSFLTQGWSMNGNANWRISTGIGNPAPSAVFSWDPPQMNYEQSLVSKEIPGEYSPILTLSYDIFLDNFSASAPNSMAVEVWHGTSWHTMKTWDNLGGNIPWTHDEIDISQFSDQTIRIRFRAFGQDSYQINGWYIDNISVLASESAHLLAPCIFGYNFYLDNTLIASVLENNYSIPGELIKYDSAYQACVMAIYASGYSEAVCDSFSSRFLWPPLNLSGSAVETSAFLTWDKPSMPADSGYFTPPGLLGYNISRSDGISFYLPSPDSLSFYDRDLEPGTWSYLVSAIYDLTPYGFPGQQDSSSATGPARVEISYGRQLPFSEPWEQGSFTYNNWRFKPEQGNWQLATSEGNPAPSARFSGIPAQTGYAYSLESPVLDASPLNCAKIFLDFDLRLDDPSASSTEELSAGIFYNGNWHKKATWKNSGPFGWTPSRIDISSVKGKGFRIGFEASGLNSANLANWNIDNILVYAECLPPENLTGGPTGIDVALQWSPPECSGGGFILNEGFENEEFPPARWTQVIHNTGATWSHTGYASPVGVHTGNYSAGISWDYNSQNEWLIVHDVFAGGNLRFWSMAFQGSTHGDHYYVKVSTDNEVTWETLFDLSALPLYPGGYNQWQEPYDIDLSPYTGEVIDIAWQAYDGTGQGCWYYWGIDDCTVGGKLLELPSMPLYNVYRQDPGSAGFTVVNSQPVSDTAYLDPGLPTGLYNYYVKVINDACRLSISSDTITVDVITSIEKHATGSLKIFPNPACDFFMIKSESSIMAVTISDITGRPVMEIPGMKRNEINIRVADLPGGLYIIKINTAASVASRIVSVSR